MSKKKKVVVTTADKTKKKVNPTTSSRQRSRVNRTAAVELVFNKENYKFMLIGVVLIALGLALMTGGAQPSPEVWEDDIIYNWRITVVAPILILAGLGVEIYAIFKK